MAVALHGSAVAVLAATSSITIGAGSNRLLIVCIGEEGAVTTAPTCTYGGQSMTHVIGAMSDPGTGFAKRQDCFRLGESGIAAASGTTITPASTDADLTIHAQAFTGVDQSSPVVQTNTNQVNASTPNPLTCPLTSVAANSAVIGFSGSGSSNSGTNTANWTTSNLTERTEVFTPVQAFDFADSMAIGIFGSSQSTVLVQCAWGNQNRAAILAAELREASVAPAYTQSKFRVYSDSGSGLGETP